MDGQTRFFWSNYQPGGGAITGRHHVQYKLVGFVVIGTAIVGNRVVPQPVVECVSSVHFPFTEFGRAGTPQRGSGKFRFLTLRLIL